MIVERAPTDIPLLSVNGVSIVALIARVAALEALPVFLSGSGAPSNGLGKNGDAYLDTVAKSVYVKAAGSWSAVGDLS